MSVRLVILGLLRERPLHGYEIKQVIEDHMSDWTSIAFGSIYFALDKLAEENFVEKIGVEQQGKRPSRSIFQITQAGREEFVRLLREGWQKFEQQYFELDLCLFFLDVLPLEEVKGYLKKRQFMLQEIIRHIQDHRTEELSKHEVPPLAAAIFDHSAIHIQAELTWTSSVLSSLESGEYF